MRGHCLKKVLCPTRTLPSDTCVTPIGLDLALSEPSAQRGSHYRFTQGIYSDAASSVGDSHLQLMAKLCLPCGIETAPEPSPLGKMEVKCLLPSALLPSTMTN